MGETVVGSLIPYERIATPWFALKYLGAVEITTTPADAELLEGLRCELERRSYTELPADHWALQG